jgi:16S rRNA (cytosine967-C5)-methyltransferase
VRAVAIRHERDDRVRRLEGKIDRVLVDAPCSGTGTLRRNPDIKWRGINLDTLVADQTRILEAAARLLKPGGRLVYATCSLLREENEDVVSGFLSRRPEFRALGATEILARRHIAVAPAHDTPSDMGISADALATHCLRLLPHRHGTDGFFALAMERCV